MTFQEQITDTIKRFCRENGGPDNAALLLGISQNTLRSWYYEQKVPRIETLSEYAEKLGIHLHAPDSPAPSIRRMSANAPVENIEGDNLKKFSVYDVAGAGPAIEVSELTPLFTVFAPPDYLRRADYAILVDGHSMEPLIPHRSVVGLKLDAPFVANELYAARIPYEGMVVKRVGVDRTTNEFIFKSENPNKEAYPDFRLNIAEAEKIIVGRIVWVMWGY